jgi:hypothetical protein
MAYGRMIKYWSPCLRITVLDFSPLFKSNETIPGSHGSVVGGGTMLQAGRSQV